MFTLFFFVSRGVFCPYSPPITKYIPCSIFYILSSSSSPSPFPTLPTLISTQQDSQMSGDGPECVLVQESDGVIKWPDGAVLDVGTDGRTALGRDGKSLQGPDGEALQVASNGRAFLASGQAFIIAVWSNGSASVLTLALRGMPGAHAAEVFADAHGRMFTKQGQLLITSQEGRPLSSHDGRYAVEDTKTKVPMLIDGTRIVRAADGSCVQWIDGSVAIVGADNRTVLGPDNKALMKNGNPIEVDVEGIVRDSIGTYIVHTPAATAVARQSNNPLNSTPRRSLTPHGVANIAHTNHQSPDIVHTRSVQLKEALNNANIELRTVKGALEDTQAELIAERVKARKDAAVVTEAELSEKFLQSAECLDLKRRLAAAEERLLQQEHEAEGVVAELQRELREAAQEDSASLNRLQVAVDTQNRRVEAREEELRHMQKRLEAEEARHRQAEETLARERQQHTEEMRMLTDSHRHTSSDYSTLRQRAQELEEGHHRATERNHLDLHMLQSKIDELTHNNRQLEEALAICDRAGTEDTLSRDTELQYHRHQLEVERGKRERADSDVLELQQRHEAHCEEVLNQLTNATVDRDRYLRLLREKERQLDELSWEKDSGAKEAQRLRQELTSKQAARTDVLESRITLEAELKKEREGRSKDSRHHQARIQELTEEKNKALRMIPDAIADAERMKAVAEERVKALQRQLNEALSSIDDYRSELSSINSERDSNVALHREHDRTVEQELDRMRTHEVAYRRDRESLEQHLTHQMSSATDKEQELAKVRRSLEKMARKKEKLERKLTESRAEQANGQSEARARGSMQIAIEQLEEQLRLARGSERERSEVVESLRQQVQQLQGENRSIIEERQAAASMRLNAVQNVVKRNTTVPGHTVSVSPGSSPVQSPATVWNSMSYQSTAQQILESPIRPVRDTVLPASRATSPPRKPVQKGEKSVDDYGGSDYARMARARNNPPVSPPT